MPECTGMFVSFICRQIAVKMLVYQSLYDTNVSYSKDWTEIHMAPISQVVVARLATLAFAGEGLARDMEWNRVMNEYTILAFGYLNQKLHESPRAMRPVSIESDPFERYPHLLI